MSKSVCGGLPNFLSARFEKGREGRGERGLRSRGNQAISKLTLAVMRTFDACLSSVALWMAVLAPPVLFFLLAQVVDNAMERGEVGVGGWMLLTALAQLLPLGALLWMLFSPAAYSIAPGKLIVHRVTSEREIPLETVTDEPRLSKGVITLSVPKRGKIHVRVQQPKICLHELRHAVGRTRAS